jgi:hypothetical protein
MVETEKTWIESALEQRLARVGAPDELWDRVVTPRAQRPRLRVARLSACGTLAVALLLVWGAGPRNVQFASSDPIAIRAFVRANSGIDVPLHAGPLVGANAAAGRAEIVYRVNRRELKLVASNADAARGRMSWSAGGRNYMLACDAPADLKACALCHLGS